MKDVTVNGFRKRRGIILQNHIDMIASTIGRNLRILDVGGRPDYWDNVPLRNTEKILLLNIESDQLNRKSQTDQSLFEYVIGDATNLHDYPDQSVDLIHSNSVIEHVGDWRSIQAMATEIRRVGRAGWVQTPAWECPIEPHYRLPFVHWFSAPVRQKIIRLRKRFRVMDLDEIRTQVEGINILTRAEFVHLFPNTTLRVERLFRLVPKSYTVTWTQQS